MFFYPSFLFYKIELLISDTLSEIIMKLLLVLLFSVNVFSQILPCSNFELKPPLYVYTCYENSSCIVNVPLKIQLNSGIVKDYIMHYTTFSPVHNYIHKYIYNSSKIYNNLSCMCTIKENKITNIECQHKKSSGFYLWLLVLSIITSMTFIFFFILFCNSLIDAIFGQKTKY